MREIRDFSAILFCLMFGANALPGQDRGGPPAKPPADVLLFTNGEKLVGQLQSATGSTVTFKSEMAGVVTVAVLQTGTEDSGAH